jgi:energy-coupling factor transporter ATP-binding protein EcfA2
MTNFNVSADVEEDLARKFSLIGIETFHIFQYRWICAQICYSSKLRRLVPRVYGLGDLTEILDERAYQQAQQLLECYKNDLANFVPTNAYRQCAKALEQHGFVAIIGEPACGKTTIANILALSAADEWKVNCVCIDNPRQFSEFWNPSNPKQFFWVDDCFGSNTYESHLVNKWNKLFPKLEAAIRQGAKVVFTSRDYIFETAKDDVKRGAFPYIFDQKFVIKIEEITIMEKVMIIYNHLKNGNQNSTFKKDVKPYLRKILQEQRMLPEVARRFGSKSFTKKISVSETGVLNFFKNPQEFLVESIGYLSDREKAALALIFVEGGKIISPIVDSERTQKFVSHFGVNLCAIRKSLGAMNGSFLMIAKDKGELSWQFRHPTMRDAFATIMASSTENMDVYLEGVSDFRLLNEVTCGDVNLSNVKMIIPASHYGKILEKLVNLEVRFGRLVGESFLSSRCSPDFLRLYFDKTGNFDYMVSWINELSLYKSNVKIISILFKANMLTDREINLSKSKVKEVAISRIDLGFQADGIRDFLSDVVRNPGMVPYVTVIDDPSVPWIGLIICVVRDSQTAREGLVGIGPIAERQCDGSFERRR